MPKRGNRNFGQQFDERRTKEALGDIGVLLGNPFSLSMEAGSTHFYHLLAMARLSTVPFPVKYLSPKLKEPRFPRGITYFGNVVDQINEILLNMLNCAGGSRQIVSWWMR